MYEDCMERFSCNRAPDRCSTRCYKPIKTHKKVVKVTKHNEHCSKNVNPNIRYVEGPPGRDGVDGASLEFQWEGNRLKTRLEGEENWTYSPNLQGQQGPQGSQGFTPYVGENGNWHINGEDLGINAYSQIVIETAKDSEKLGGQEPSYYATSEALESHTHEIGGTNYILNSNIVTSGWQNGVTVSRTDEGYLKIIVTKDGGACTINNANTVENNFKSGDYFTFSMDIKSDDATISPKVYYNGSLSYERMSGSVTTEFSAVYNTRVWNDGGLSIHLNFNEIGTYYIRNVKFEKGKHPTDWIPAKEDWLGTGVTGIVNANSNNFNITTAMLGKRIICSSTADHRFVNLPSPIIAGKGAMVEIMANGSQFVEVNTPEGTIQKGNINEAKCVQPCFTTRRYYSDGTKWITNFEKISSYSVLEVGFNSTNGTDDIPKFGWHGGYRVFKSLSNLKHLQEYRYIRARIYTEAPIVLDSNLLIEDCDISFIGNYGWATLTIPSDYTITLKNCNLFLSRLTLNVDGIGFKCYGKIAAILGDMHGATIRPNSNTNFSLFYIDNSDILSFGCTTLSLMLRCNIDINNLTEYTATGNIIYNASAVNPKPAILIDTGAQGNTKVTNIKWYNGSDTLSRIGTSSVYTVG